MAWYRSIGCRVRVGYLFYPVAAFPCWRRWSSMLAASCVLFPSHRWRRPCAVLLWRAPILFDAGAESGAGRVRLGFRRPHHQAAWWVPPLYTNSVCAATCYVQAVYRAWVAANCALIWLCRRCVCCLLCAAQQELRVRIVNCMLFSFAVSRSAILFLLWRREDWCRGCRTARSC